MGPCRGVGEPWVLEEPCVPDGCGAVESFDVVNFEGDWWDPGDAFGEEDVPLPILGCAPVGPALTGVDELEEVPPVVPPPDGDRRGFCTPLRPGRRLTLEDCVLGIKFSTWYLPPSGGLYQD